MISCIWTYFWKDRTASTGYCLFHEGFGIYVVWQAVLKRRDKCTTYNTTAYCHSNLYPLSLFYNGPFLLCVTPSYSYCFIMVHSFYTYVTSSYSYCFTIVHTDRRSEYILLWLIFTVIPMQSVASFIVCKLWVNGHDIMTSSGLLWQQTIQSSGRSPVATNSKNMIDTLDWHYRLLKCVREKILSRLHIMEWQCEGMD